MTELLHRKIIGVDRLAVAKINPVLSVKFLHDEIASEEAAELAKRCGSYVVSAEGCTLTNRGWESVYSDAFLYFFGSSLPRLDMEWGNGECTTSLANNSRLV